ncbi:hypothetical protein AB3X96_36835 [Paraburkholderia sp. BR13439]|uniref:hypothetical protein n=1 Tax=unclassified Paraburkholderia TaxID=2615204 RepID=UPI0034CEFB6E
MANQRHAITLTRAYARSDIPMLRAFARRTAPATIARLYFAQDENGNEPTAGWVESYPRRMQVYRMELAIVHASPVLAGHLKASTKAHDSFRLTAHSLKMVEQATARAPSRKRRRGTRRADAGWVPKGRVHRHRRRSCRLLASCATAAGSVLYRASGPVAHDGCAYADIAVDDHFAAPPASVGLSRVRRAGLCRSSAWPVRHALSGINGTDRCTTIPYIAAR